MKPSEFMHALRDEVVRSGSRLDLAAKLGLEYQRLGYFVRNPTSKPDMALVDKLAEHFGYSICSQQ